MPLGFSENGKYVLMREHGFEHDINLFLYEFGKFSKPLRKIEIDARMQLGDVIISNDRKLIVGLVLIENTYGGIIVINEKNEVIFEYNLGKYSTREDEIFYYDIDNGNNVEIRTRFYNLYLENKP